MLQHRKNPGVGRGGGGGGVCNHSCLCQDGYHIRRLMINNCYFPLPGLDKLTENSSLEGLGVYIEDTTLYLHVLKISLT